MNKWFWLGGIGVAALLFYLTRGIILPFLAGLAIAYFLDPVADKLEARKVPRSLAAAMVISLFFLVIIAILLAFWPVLQSQIVAASHALPKTLAGLRPWLNETLLTLSERFGANISTDVDGLVASFSGEILAKIRDAATGALKSGLALFNLLSLALISPVVAFYLLRDWDRIVDKINGWLPPSNGATIRAIATKIDTVLAGFVRGQLLVSTAMGVLYGVGWAVTGLDFAIVLGVLAGVLSFIPFVGALFAAGVAVAMAFGQWGFDPLQIAFVGAVFFVVQTIEGAFLTPRLIGERVGLHPVWVLFAVFAGGEVMGFVGVLIAVPAAAAIAVLVRFYIDQYLDHYDLQPREGSEEADEPAAEEAK